MRKCGPFATIPSYQLPLAISSNAAVDVCASAARVISPCAHPTPPSLQSFGEFQGFKSANVLGLGQTEDFHGRVAGQTATVSVEASAHAASPS